MSVWAISSQIKNECSLAKFRSLMMFKNIHHGGLMMKILITGGTGFIGSHLVETLVSDGYDVRCLVRRTSKVNVLDNVGVEKAYETLKISPHYILL